jgi:DNA-binding NarL/FixJ family response regulator
VKETEKPRRPPLVVSVDGASIARVAEELKEEGWAVQPGFCLPQRTWAVAGLKLVCTGTVAGPDDAAAAVMAATRGAGVVVAVEASAAVQERLFEDLSRLGPVTLWHEPPNPVAGLSEETRVLLELLTNGASVSDAARALHCSLRTTERRLAAARDALGARTTAEALVYFKQNRAQS